MGSFYKAEIGKSKVLLLGVMKGPISWLHTIQSCSIPTIQEEMFDFFPLIGQN